MTNGAHNVKQFEYFADRDLSHAFDLQTGVLKREEIIGYVSYLISKGKPFTFGIADIDNFKTVNDTYGHVRGDVALSAMAEYLCEKFDGIGVVGRYGGDEFMLVLEDYSEYKDVWTVAHSVNMDIGKVRAEGCKGLSMTITMGLCRYPHDAANFSELLALADKALYRGKMKGRNCFIIYLEEKHKNIDINDAVERRYSSTHLCSRVFTYLTSSKDMCAGIQTLFHKIVAYFMVDHICIETRKGTRFHVIHRLSKVRDFSKLDYDEINNLLNNAGLAYFNKISNLHEEDYGPVIKQLQQTQVSSGVYCKISAFGNEYGFIRVDMTDTARIWQQDDLNVLVIAANTIGLMLYYQNKTIDGLPECKPILVGGED